MNDRGTDGLIARVTAKAWRSADCIFKPADSAAEREQIYALNYQAFVHEVPQHADTGNGRLVDKFDGKNCYVVALRHQRVVGMIAVHDQPPFSVADRLSDPRTLDRLGSRLLEVRLLAVERAQRGGPVLPGLLWTVYDLARRGGYSHMLISGVVERLDLYDRMGFHALGPPIPCGRSAFVPMALSLDEMPNRVRRLLDHVQRHGTQDGALDSL